MKKIIKKIVSFFVNCIVVYLIPKTRKIISDVDFAEKIMQNHFPDSRTSALWDNSDKKSEKDLTIIIPVYNVEKYLEKCIESVINQKTCYIYDIVIVDDCSPDNSANILKKYDNIHNVTILHHSSNKGFSGARNTGLSTMSGRYVTFVDSDDFLPENAVQDLLETAYRLDADIVQGGYCHIDNISEEIHSKEVYNYCTKVPANGVIAGMAWAKIYKANLFYNVCFPEKYWYEDTIITSLVSHMAKSIVTIPSIVYYYRQNPLGVTKLSKGKPKSIDTFWVQRCILEAREELGLKTDIKFYEHMLRMVILSYKRTEVEPKTVRKSMFILFGEMLKSMRQDDFKVEKKYLNLEKAIMEKDYNKYALLCKFL